MSDETQVAEVGTEATEGQAIDETNTGTGDFEAGAATDNGGFGEAVKLDPQQADAHRGEIISISAKTFDTGSTALIIASKSHDTGIDGKAFEMALFGPADLFDSGAACWENGHFSPSKLSSEPPPGKKQSPKEAYGKNYFNTKNTGIVQGLFTAAAEEGRTPVSVGIVSAKNPDEYVANLNLLLSGTQVLIVRRPEKNDDERYDGNLKVKAFYPISVLNDAKRLDGVTKGCRRMFE